MHYIALDLISREDWTEVKIYCNTIQLQILIQLLVNLVQDEGCECWNIFCKCFHPNYCNCPALSYTVELISQVSN